MSQIKDNTQQYKKEIKNGFEALEPGNNQTIKTEKLNEVITSTDSKNKKPFLYKTIKSLVSQKKKENEEEISLEEYLSFIDNQLDDIESEEGLQKIFSALCDSNHKNFSWTNLPLILKELGDDEMANKLLKLLEQAKLYNKDLNFKEFTGIMSIEDDYVKSNKIESEDYEDVESYKQRKLKNNKKEEYEEVTLSSKNSYKDSYKDKNEDNKKSGEDNDGEKSSKRYHRRYRDNKAKNDNNDNGNGNNKVHYKYRKKHI